jgi:hypothetical protein
MSFDAFKFMNLSAILNISSVRAKQAESASRAWNLMVLEPLDSDSPGETKARFRLARRLAFRVVCA